MPLFSIIVLSLVQAVTEFLPISSSGHLVIMHGLMDRPGSEAWGDDLIMDLAMHVGTLLAVITYYWRDVWAMVLGLWHWVTRAPGNKQDVQSRNLAFTLVLASLPVMAVGVVLTLWEPEFLRSVQIVVWTTLIYGILLWWVDARYPADKPMSDLGWKGALLIGCAQCLALVPGTSRSGVTMTAARLQGLARPEAARFSFLLSIIATAAAGAMGALKLIKSGDMTLAGDALIALVITFVAALGVMAFLMKFLQTHTFKAFGIYRIILGIILLIAVYGFGWE